MAILAFILINLISKSFAINMLIYLKIENLTFNIYYIWKPKSRYYFRADLLANSAPSTTQG